MIHMKPFIFLLVAAGFGLTSCSSPYVYFTESLREQEKWSESDLRRIQFYVSRDIVLTRTLGTGETSIQEGKVIVKDGRKTERIVVAAFTPGVVVMMPEAQRLAVSFEEGGRESFLMFGPNPDNNNRYSLLAQTWYSDYGDVNYQGKLFAADASCAYASLMVDLRRTGQEPAKVHRAKGRRIE